ncbi:FUSC family protein [Rhodococcus hoagii]|nr:FUSC family protein [Prescottella equi]
MTARDVGAIRRLVRFLTVTDPGYFRLRRAVTTVSALAGAVAILTAMGHAVNHTVPAVLLGAFVSVQASSAVKNATQRDRVLTTAFLIVPALAAVTLGALLQEFGAAADVAFVGVLFLAVWIRRWGPGGFAAGMVAYVAYFYTLVLHATTADLPLLCAGVCTGVLVTLIVRAFVLPERPRREIESLVTALRSAARAALEIATRCGHGDRAFERSLNRVETTVVLIEDWIDRNDAESVLGISNQAFSQMVFGVRCETEIASEALADAAAADLEHESIESDVAALVTRATAAQARLGNAMHGHRVGAGAAREHRPLSGATPTDTSCVSSTTRSAVQVAVAASAAALLGSAVDSERWYWAVLTAFLVYTGTSTRGEVLVRAGERVAGTVGGVVAGMFVVGVVGGNVLGQTAVVMVSLFLAFYLVAVDYIFQTVFMTVMLAGLYELLGEFSAGLLVVRIEETVIGAVVGIVAAHTVLASSSRDAFTSTVDRYLAQLSSLIGKTVPQQDPPVPAVEVLSEVRALDADLAEIEAAASTLVADPATRGRRSVSWLLRRLRGINRAAHALAAVGAGVRTPDAASEGRPEEARAVDVVARGVRDGIELARQRNVGAKSVVVLRAGTEEVEPGHRTPVASDDEAIRVAALNRIGRLVADLSSAPDASGRTRTGQTADRNGRNR